MDYVRYLLTASVRDLTLLDSLVIAAFEVGMFAFVAWFFSVRRGKR